MYTNIPVHFKQHRKPDLVFTVVFVLYSCSGHLIPYTEEFICTVVLGYDVVPRLGLVEAIQLRIDVLHALRYCNLPKVIIEYSIVKFYFFKVYSILIS